MPKKKKSVTERMKSKYDEYMEELKKAKGSGLLQKAIRAKRKHKKELEEGVHGFKNRSSGKR